MVHYPMYLMFWRIIDMFFLRNSILHQFRKSKSVIFFLVIGFGIAVFCISITFANLGYRRDSIIRLREYSTITFNPDTETKKNSRAVIEYAETISPKGVYNAILATPLGEGKYILGWKGFAYDFWMAPSTGRFFTEAEQDDAANVAYVSESVLNQLDDPTTVYLNNEAYQIVGDTLIVNHDFYYVVPEASDIQLFKDGREDLDLFNQYEFIILPYETYLKHYQPTQILIQFYDGTTRNMQRYERLLKERFPESTAYKPDRTPDEELNYRENQYRILSYFFCYAVLLTLIQLIWEWIKLYKPIYVVYHAVGLSPLGCICLLYAQLMVYLFFGMLLSYGFFVFLRPSLDIMKISSISSFGYYIESIFLSFIAIYICFTILVLVEYRFLWRRPS